MAAGLGGEFRETGLPRTTPTMNVVPTGAG
jgi:hypothetical protein